MAKEEIVAIFNKNKNRYGYRRITKELHNNDICIHQVDGTGIRKRRNIFKMLLRFLLYLNFV